MKIAILIAALISTQAIADWGNPLETTEQARQRQSAENFEAYRSRENSMIPPTYDRGLEPTMPGVERPGYQPDFRQRDYLRD